MSGAPSGDGTRAPTVTIGDGLWLLAWLFVGQIMLEGLALEIGAIDRSGGPGDRMARIGILSAVLAAALAWLALRGRLSGVLAPRRRPKVADAVIGVLVGAVAFVLLVMALGLVFRMVGGVDPPRQRALEDVVGGGTTAVLAVVMAVLLAPLVEELVFRGGLYQGLKGSLGRWPAALLSAGVFAAVHVEVIASSPIFLVQLLLLGLLFVWIFERTGNLLAPVAAHMAFNATSIAVVHLGAASG